MKRFVYISADRGIPVPGHKGSSHHVTNVCRTFRRMGWSGTLFTARPQAPGFSGVPIRSLSELHDTRLHADFVYERYSLWHVDGLERARRFAVPFYLEVNSPLPDEARKFRDLPDERGAQRVARHLMRCADGVVCVSQSVADWVAGLRDTTDGVWVVPNGVDETIFSSRYSSHAIPFESSTGPVIGFSGSFRPWHGVHGLLDAVQKSGSRPRLLCVGDGPGRASFEQHAQRLGLKPRVYTTGFVPHEQVPRWLNGCDLAVAPYEPCDDFYFSPLKVFEFMALGLPVIAPDIGQLSEILGAGERGTLYPAGDSTGLADAIDRVISDRASALDRANRARRWTLQNATWSKRVQTILERIGAVRANDG